MTNSRRALCFAAVLAAAGCRKTEPSERIVMIPSHGESAPAAGASQAKETAAGQVEVAGLSFAAPSGWRRESPTSPMRAAQFAIPGTGKGGDGLFVVYFFGSGQGGSVAENVERWKGQFLDASGSSAPARVSTDRKHGLSVTVVTSEGTYSPGLPMGSSSPEPNSELWGAIVEGPQGNVFFKATGPKATIEGARAGFAAVLDSIKPSSTMM